MSIARDNTLEEITSTVSGGPTACRRQNRFSLGENGSFPDALEPDARHHHGERIGIEPDNTVPMPLSGLENGSRPAHRVHQDWHALNEDGTPRTLRDLPYIGAETPDQKYRTARERALAPIYENVTRELGAPMMPATSSTWNDRSIAIGKAQVKLRYRYNFKEVVNPLDWTYLAGSQKVRIFNYSQPEHSRTIDATSLRPRILAYGARWGDWHDPDDKKKSGRPIDGWYGHLAYGRARDTAIECFARERTHSDSCSCGECNEYGRPEWRPELEEEPIDPVNRPFR
jgi:hypothetical protein